MSPTSASTTPSLSRDFTAGLVVFLVALPLCLGVALASNAPLLSGVIAGIVGGIVVGILSGSHTSVSGPAAGLTAVVSAQILSLGSFDTFLLAVVLAGAIQIVLGLARAGMIAAFVPSGVIKGLLAAIGIILILKQFPHVVGHDPDPEGDLAFDQPDHENTFSELLATFSDLHPGAALIGLASILLLVAWDRTKALKKSPIPAPLAIVLFGIAASEILRLLGAPWTIESSHLVQVPVAESFAGMVNFLQMPDFHQITKPAVYSAAITLAAVASLETLLNLEAVDRIDPRQRNSPPSRELVAQGVGNIVSGMIGGLPVTSVIIRSSVNIHAGNRSKLSTIIHGLLLLGSVTLLPTWLNMIPLSCLAAILLMTGIKLASPKLLREMWAAGKYQFAPFIVTVVAIILTDLLIGVLIGLGVSITFILWSNVRRPLRRVVEKHLGGDVLRIELANQVSFLNRAALSRAFDEAPRGGHILIDANGTDYIDPDVLDLIRDFAEHSGPARGVEVSLKGFRHKYHLQDHIQYVDYSTRDIQESLTPMQVLEILRAGSERFRTGRRLTRDLGRQVAGTAAGQHPLAVVLSCIDSRTPAELILDLGVGDIFSVRVAGNVASRKILGSMEYGCAVAGAKLVLVLGHTRCGAVTATLDLACSHRTAIEATGCEHLDDVIDDIRAAVDPTMCLNIDTIGAKEKEDLVTVIARRNVELSVQRILKESGTLARLVREGRLAIVGALYDVSTGAIEFLGEPTAQVD